MPKAGRGRDLPCTGHTASKVEPLGPGLAAVIPIQLGVRAKNLQPAADQ